MTDINIQQLILDLRKKRDAILERMRGSEFELIEIERQLAAAEQTEELYYRQYNMPLPGRSPDARLQRKFIGLSIREMLILIALEAEDTLDVADAKRILIKAGVFRDERNAATSIAPIISRNGDIFKREARGNYMLDRSAMDQKDTRLLQIANKTNDLSTEHSKQKALFERRQAAPMFDECRPWQGDEGHENE